VRAILSPTGVHIKLASTVVINPLRKWRDNTRGEA
jgi:hypothetical protein